MHLIQLLLPVYDNNGRAFARATFDRVRTELTALFGGVTAFSHAPAEGIWKDDEGEVSRDRVMVFEVMAERLDREWWARYRAELEERFRQDKIVARASEFEEL